jgi:hypothetical protein
MVIHSCKNCSKNFYKKSTYKNHVENKKKICNQNDSNLAYSLTNPAKSLQTNINDDDVLKNNILLNIKTDVYDNKTIKHICQFCSTEFTRSDNLKTHINKNCKVRKEQDANKDKIIELLVKKDEQIEQLLKQNHELIVKLSETNTHSLTNAHNTTDSNNTNTNNGSITTNNGSITTNNGHITTNNIKIEFGKENLDKISNDFFIKTLLNFSGAAIPSKIIEGIHFNPELKEFMNVFITDMSRNKAMIHDGHKWNIANADEVVNTLFDRAVNFCEDRNEELKEKIEKNDKINKKITKEMYIIDIMTNNEPYEYDEYNQPIDIDGRVLKIDELKRGKRLNVKAKEHLKKNLYNKKEIVQKIK